MTEAAILAAIVDVTLAAIVDATLAAIVDVMQAATVDEKPAGTVDEMLAEIVAMLGAMPDVTMRFGTTLAVQRRSSYNTD